MLSVIFYGSNLCFSPLYACQYFSTDDFSLSLIRNSKGIVEFKRKAKRTKVFAVVSSRVSNLIKWVRENKTWENSPPIKICQYVEKKEKNFVSVKTGKKCFEKF